MYSIIIVVFKNICSYQYYNIINNKYIVKKSYFLECFFASELSLLFVCFSFAF